MKECLICHRFLGLESYYKSAGKSDGHQNRCKNCDKQRQLDRRLADPLAFRAERRAARLRRRVLQDYPEIFTSREDYESRRAAASCQICGGTDRMSFDHDHATGAGRGWLCGRCNSGLGMFQDDPARLRAAADYLERQNALGFPPPVPVLASIKEQPPSDYDG